MSSFSGSLTTSIPVVCPYQSFCHLLRSVNRLNHHHLPHHAALHRRPLTSELVQFSLVPIKRVNLLPYDPARTSCLSSRTLGCTQLRSCPFPCGERHTWSRWPNGQLRKRFSRRALAKRNGDAAWALIPEVRAGCGKAACPDPWRGLWATMIPTPTQPDQAKPCSRL